MKQPQPDLASDPAIVYFVAVAKEFCRLLELKRRHSKRRFVEQVLKSMLTLYAAGLELPNLRPESGFSPLGEWYEKHKHMPLQERIKQDPQVQEHTKLYALIRNKISSSLGDEYCYRKVFEPFEPNAGAINMTLSDDLADIYCDLKEGLLKIGRRS